ncbi:MAG: protein adenylyltransferase SelO family protein, partial [Erythrobacter sp.]|nr:protein adenylyltransferase SelO family protein [Erythrobacter sp.]
GLYAFGRQPEALHWNCGQLAVALRLLADTAPLIAALERFAPLYMAAVARRWCWRLGVAPQGLETDTQLVAACEAQMRETGAQPDAFFFSQRQTPGTWLTGYEPAAMPDGSPHEYWADPAPQSLLLDEVETIWAAIDEGDDWGPFHAKVAALRRMGTAHGAPPPPAGHAADPEN